jgi:hypothetical protein
MLNEEGDAEEEEVDPLDAFMAAEVLPEVKAREEEERKKAAEERAKLQELLKVRCACCGGHACGAVLCGGSCVWGLRCLLNAEPARHAWCARSWMAGTGLLLLLSMPLPACLLPAAHCMS